MESCESTMHLSRISHRANPGENLVLLRLARELLLAIGRSVSHVMLGVDPHAEAMSGTKRDRRQELECLAGLDRQAIPAGDRGEDKHSLHHREVIADADARPIAERE